ncbi:17789_t:CDS:2, partial [Racocetra persica]
SQFSLRCLSVFNLNPSTLNLRTMNAIRGARFEIEISEEFVRRRIELRRTRHEPGDGGIDLFGGYTIILQCKVGKSKALCPGTTWKRQLRSSLHRECRALPEGQLIEQAPPLSTSF